MLPATVRPTAAGKVALIAITAALYAVAKGLTAFIPTPFGVGQFLLFIFVPAFFAITGDTLSAATGAAMMLLTAHAMAAGPLAASQPGFTILSPVTACLLGVFLFGEQLGSSLLDLAAEAGGLLALAAGVRALSRSRLITESASEVPAASHASEPLRR